MRPFRSVLYMPGSNARALEKAKSLAADALILDLEDAVAPDMKAEARSLISDAVNAGGYGQRYLIARINGFETEWAEDDIKGLSSCAPHALLLPKVNTANDILALEDKISRFDAYKNTKIWAMIETPLGVLNAKDIAASSKRLEGFVLGTNDLVKDLHARHVSDRTPVLASLNMSILAARAHGLICVDGVFNRIKDEDGLTAECEHGRNLGFDGKTLIHPAQIDTANSIFGPTEDDIAEAKLFVTAYNEAIAEGKAVALVNGRIVENLHVENAKRILAQSEAISSMLEEI